MVSQESIDGKYWPMLCLMMLFLLVFSVVTREIVQPAKKQAKF
jgi:hypothetical protein